MVIAKPLSQWLTKPAYANILGFLIIFCLIFLVVSIIGIVIKYLMNIAFMGWVDRICGAAFGAIKGLLIVAVLLIVFTAFLSKGTPFMKESLLAPHMAVISEKMAKVVSPEMKRQFTSKIQELKKTW
jgi:membrane protein required for colicin V production